MCDKYGREIIEGDIFTAGGFSEQVQGIFEMRSNEVIFNLQTKDTYDSINNLNSNISANILKVIGRVI